MKEIRYRLGGYEWKAEQAIGTLAPAHTLPADVKWDHLVCGHVYDSGAGEKLAYLGTDDNDNHYFGVATESYGELYYHTPSLSFVRKLIDTGERCETIIPANDDYLDATEVKKQLLAGEPFFNVITKEQAFRMEEDADISERMGYETACLINWSGISEELAAYDGLIQAPIDSTHDTTVSIADLAKRIAGEPGWGKSKDVAIDAMKAAEAAMRGDSRNAIFTDSDNIEWKICVGKESGAFEVWCHPFRYDDPWVSFSHSYTDSYISADAAAAGAVALAAAVARREHGHLVEDHVERHCRRQVFGEDLYPGGIREWKEEVLAAQGSSRASSPSTLDELEAMSSNQMTSEVPAITKNISEER